MTAINCPVCEAAFKEVVKEGVHIDVCTRCKGVWLDRGELEKLLATVRAGEDESYLSITAPPPSRAQPRPAHYYHHDDDDYRRHSGHGYYRKKSKLETLFDIFD